MVQRRHHRHRHARGERAQRRQRLRDDVAGAAEGRLVRVVREPRWTWAEAVLAQERACCSAAAGTATADTEGEAVRRMHMLDVHCRRRSWRKGDRATPLVASENGRGLRGPLSVAQIRGCGGSRYPKRSRPRFLYCLHALFAALPLNVHRCGGRLRGRGRERIEHVLPRADDLVVL